MPGLRILISAYACGPGEGSEPGVGWHWVRQAARFHEVWVITRANNQPAIDRALAAEPLPCARFIYYDLPRWLRFWKAGQRGVRLYYCLWQLGAYSLCKKLHRQVGFDLVHHLTFGVYWLPTFLALLPAPFVWGPVGGAESAPVVLSASLGLRGAVFEVLRGLVRKLGEWNPLAPITARRAALALAKTRETAKRLEALGCREVVVLSEAGLSEEEIQQLGGMRLRHRGPFRVISLGRLVYWKGFALGLKAFARFCRSHPESEYWIIGDGPERRRLEKLSRNLGVAERVIFWRQMPRARVLEQLARCDLLLHPSLHDSGGWVCLEAMAAGRPVICLDLGGPALQVTEETGIKVRAGSPGQVVRDLAEALIRVANEPALRLRMGEAARLRVRRHFTWDRKGDLWSEVHYGSGQALASNRC